MLREGFDSVFSLSSRFAFIILSWQQHSAASMTMLALIKIISSKQILEYACADCPCPYSYEVKCWSLYDLASTVLVQTSGR